jgi:hypothetical protein
MTALFFVRAEVADPSDREAFDRWYQEEHLPQVSFLSLSLFRSFLTC